MILNDGDIEKLCDSKYSDVLIFPFLKSQLQPASYDLQLGEWQDTKLEGYLLPGEFILGSTREEVCIPDWLTGRMEGKSSRARVGLIVHAAGFVDPGFRGQLTLEMTNLSGSPLPLAKGLLIAQIAFIRLSAPALRPYGSQGLGSHYQGQIGPTKAFTSEQI